MSDSNKKKILIIDDDEFLLDMYSLKFREMGFEVEIAKDGEDALNKIKDGANPDLILLDLVMPKMDGFTFLEEMKKIESGSKKPKLIILSNLGQKKDIERGKELGADDFIVKAYFTPGEVVEKVKSLLL